MLTDDNILDTPQRRKREAEAKKPLPKPPRVGRFRGLSRKHPLMQLRAQIRDAARAKKIPPRVLLQISHVFQAVPKDAHTWTADRAQLEARRIGAHVEWLRSSHALLHLDPTDKGYLPLSKATSPWLNVRLKLSEHNAKRNGAAPERKSVPVPRTAPPESADDSDQEPMG